MHAYIPIAVKALFTLLCVRLKSLTLTMRYLDYFDVIDVKLGGILKVTNSSKDNV